MKIGVIAHLKHPIREPFAGGLEMHTHSLCQLLIRRGHRLTLFAAPGSAEGLGLEDIGSGIGEAATAEEAFRIEHRVYAALMENLRHRDFDVIHNNSLHYIPLALAGGLPMPMVTVLHTPPFWEMEGGIAQTDARNSRFLAVSSFIRDQWTPITRVDEVIHNGIDLKNFKFADRPAAAPYAAWSGRIVPEKGLHLALAAARRAGITLRIAGPISDHGYFEKAIKPQLGAHARYEGHLDHHVLAELIRGARAFLFTPLWDEPYGLVVAEALACGTPVASFARGAVSEILDQTCGLIVPPGDVTALARAVIDVQRLRRADCRARAEAIAGDGEMIAQYESFYRRLVRKHSPAPASLKPAGPGFPDMVGPRALLAHYLAGLPAIASDIPIGLRT